MKWNNLKNQLGCHWTPLLRSHRVRYWNLRRFPPSSLQKMYFPFSQNRENDLLHWLEFQQFSLSLSLWLSCLFLCLAFFACLTKCSSEFKKVYSRLCLFSLSLSRVKFSNLIVSFASAASTFKQEIIVSYKSVAFSNQNHFQDLSSYSLKLFVLTDVPLNSEFKQCNLPFWCKLITYYEWYSIWVWLCPNKV